MPVLFVAFVEAGTGTSVVFPCIGVTVGTMAFEHSMRFSQYFDSYPGEEQYQDEECDGYGEDKNHLDVGDWNKLSIFEL